MFFLRYTTTANEDLERNASYHGSGMSQNEAKINEIASAFGCAETDIVLLDNGIHSKGVANNDMCYFQKLVGLCGFELDAETLEEAIEEANEFYFNNVYNSELMGDMITIFEGDYLGGNIEGCFFNAEKIVFSK